ncbi:MAG TPA: hypothetical protein VGM82_09775 [Gemmatimonadaceae bacterium]
MGTLVSELGKEFSAALKTLLEEKHLYQSVSVDPVPLVQRMRDRLPEVDQRRLAAMGGTGIEAFRFILSNEPLDAVGREGHRSALPIILVENLKLFCAACESREVFAPVWFKDVEEDIHRARPIFPGGGSAPSQPPPCPTQVFGIGFRCQLCKGDLTTFFVRRSRWKLVLEGRSPIEHIELPKHMPKVEAHLFRDALVAAHAGKGLAALFYLRTFIEQFARRQTNLRGKETGEAIMSAYSKLLPEKQRDMMPSFAEWYDKLSGALHSAQDDASLFESARTEIERHFEIRKVFSISDGSTTERAL